MFGHKYVFTNGWFYLHGVTTNSPCAQLFTSNKCS